MGRSLERLSSGRNMDIPKDAEGINGYANKPQSFTEHLASVRKMKEMIDSLPMNDEPIVEQTKEQQVAAARESVMAVFGNKKEAAPMTSEEIEKRRQEAIARIEKLQATDEQVIEMIKGWSQVQVDQEALRAATLKNGNPNSHAKGTFFGNGNLPMDDNSIYRHVGPSAIVDLMQVGFVRNKREAADALDIPGKKGFGTSGAVVYWNDGDSSKSEHADMVFEARKSAADEGYVTIKDIKGIWVTDVQTNQPVNLLDGQNHDGLQMGSHR